MTESDDAHIKIRNNAMGFVSHMQYTRVLLL